MKIPFCSTCNSRDCFVKLYASAVWKKKTEKEKTTIHFNKGEAIFREGDPVNGIYFIYQGKVKVFKRGVKEKNHIVRLAGSGKILGHRGFGNIKTYPIGASALEPSTICFIPKDLFIEILNNNPGLSLALMNFYAEELRRVENKLVSLSQMTAKQKIAETLLTIAEIHGTKKENGIEYLKVELTRQEYADITGTSIEEVIRTLSLLNKEGIITLEGRMIGLAERKKLVQIILEFGNLRIP